MSETKPDDMAELKKLMDRGFAQVDWQLTLAAEAASVTGEASWGSSAGPRWAGSRQPQPAAHPRARTASPNR